MQVSSLVADMVAGDDGIGDVVLPRHGGMSQRDRPSGHDHRVGPPELELDYKLDRFSVRQDEVRSPRVR